MTKNINKLSFWKTVQNEWRENQDCYFLCRGSKAFKKVYSRESNRADLGVLKRKFLTKSKIRNSVFEPMPPYNDNKHVPLFFVRHSKDFRRVRTNFITWNIQRLSQK